MYIRTSVDRIAEMFEIRNAAIALKGKKGFKLSSDS